MSKNSELGDSTLQISEYEKFRIARLGEASDYDNVSAHFSNQLSTRTINESEWDFKPSKMPDNREKERQLEEALSNKQKDL